MNPPETIPTDKSKWDTYSASAKLLLAAIGFQQRIRPRRNLIAGPYAGEFGYELMQWQGYVRARRPAYDQVHVLTFPGRDYLYEGCRVHAHAIPLHLAGYRYGVLNWREARDMAHAKAAEIGLKDYDIFQPALLCTRHHKRLFWRQDFRVFEEPPIEGRMRDITFHFRWVKKVGDHQKNYPREMADRLAELCRQDGLSVACIGHPDYSLCATGCEDHRSVDLRQTVAAISSARLVVGEVSGPMHLAGLSGKATVVWAPAPRKVDYALRWNPFRAPIYVAADDTHEPKPERTYAAIVKAMADLKSRTQNFQQPAFRLPATQIAYF